MNFLISAINASNKPAIMDTNAEGIDRSLAFMLTPSLVSVFYPGPPAHTDIEPTTELGGPSVGDHVEGELWVDALCAIWRCTVAGTPGTWIQMRPAVILAADIPATAPDNYLVMVSDGPWTRFYWDGAAWQPVFLGP